jgi:hypothetical protein
MKYGLAVAAMMFAGALSIVPLAMAEPKGAPGHQSHGATDRQLKTQSTTGGHTKNAPSGAATPKPSRGGGPAQPPGVIESLSTKY